MLNAINFNAITSNAIIEHCNTFAQAWAWWLGMSIVDAAVVLGAISLLWFVIRRKVPPQLGYLLFLLVPLKLFVPLYITVPERFFSWAPKVVPEVTRTTEAQRIRPDSTPPAPPSKEPFVPQFGEMTIKAAPRSQHRAEANDHFPPPPAHSEPSRPVNVDHAASPMALTWLLFAWLLGILVLLARLAHAQLHFPRTILRTASVVDPSLLSVDFRGLLQQMRIGANIRILESNRTSSPVVWGIFRPTLILPAGMAASLPQKQLEWVLLHELAHVQRHDLLVNCFQRVAGILHFLNPSIWIANRAIDRLREYICDDMASAYGGISPLESGEAFMGVMRYAASIRNRPVTNLAGALGMFEWTARASCFHRMNRLLDSERRLSVKIRWGSLCLLLLTTALALPQIRASAQQQAQVRAPAIANSPAKTVKEVSAATQTQQPPAAPATMAPQSAADETDVAVSGIVYSADGKPAVGARVWAAAVFVSPPLRFFTTTDSSGQFHFRLRPLEKPDEWGIHARLDDQGGDANNVYGYVNIIRSRPAKNVEIRMEPRGWLRGRVVEAESQKPIARTRIFMDDGEIIATEADGHFERGGLRLGSHSMVLAAPGRGRKSVLLDTSLHRDARLDVPLVSAGKVTGQVLDNDGRPVAGAYVRCSFCSSPLTEGGFEEACDDQGRFEMDGVMLDQLQHVEASASCEVIQGTVYLSAADSTEMHGTKGSPNLVFHLPRRHDPAMPNVGKSDNARESISELPMRDLKGVVRSAGGDPVAHALVRWGATLYETTRRETRTDATGRFVLPQVPDRDGYVTISDPKHAPQFLAVKKGKTEIAVQLEIGRSVGGVVQTSSGKPLSGVQVVPVIPSPDRTLCNPYWLTDRSTTTDAQGHFEIRQLPKAFVRFDFMSVGSSDERNHELKLGQSDNIVKMSATGAVRGIVVDPTGKPVRNFRILVQMPIDAPQGIHSGDFDAAFQFKGITFTSDDGSFVVSDLVAGNVERIVAVAPGYGQAVRNLQKVLPLNELPPADSLRLQLTEPHKVHVYVSTKADPQRPLAETAVTKLYEYTAADRQFSWGYHDYSGERVDTGPDGWASFADVPEDEALLTIRRPGFARQRIVWRKDQQEIKVQMQPEAVVTGIMYLKPGQPLGSFTAQLNASAGDQFSVGSEPKDKGRFRFNQLPAGKYSLTVEDERRTIYSKEVELQTGKTVDMSIDLSKLGNKTENELNIEGF